MLGTIILGLVVSAVCVLAWVSLIHGHRGRRASRAAFDEKYGGRVVLVADTRWGWYDFVMNNIVPVLPEGAEVIWYRGHTSQSRLIPEPGSAIDIDAFWLQRLVVPPQPPYAFLIAGRCHSIVPLQEALHPLKLAGTGRDEDKRSVVAELLAPLHLRIRSVDRDGHLYIYDNILDAEGYLEWIDVEGGEYVVIDDDAYLYSWQPSNSGFYGYSFVRADSRSPDVLAALEGDADYSMVPPDRLKVARSHGPASRYSA